MIKPLNRSFAYQPPAVPYLEPGDRLTRAEFERRYEAMPNLKKAELIDGVVHMPSPVRLDYHAAPHADMIAWLRLYAAETPGVQAAADSTLRLDRQNEFQPDGILLVLPECGGQAQKSESGFLEGAPEWVGEIAASSASIDLGRKREVYLRCGVREYFVWQVMEHALDWFALKADEFKPLRADTQGILKSRVFPGLWLHVTALLRSDLRTVRRILELGLATPEHAAFVKRLAARRS